MRRRSWLLWLLAVPILPAPVFAAGPTLSRTFEVHGDEMSERLEAMVDDMKRELAGDGCPDPAVAYWSESTPLWRLRVEVRCRSEAEASRTAARSAHRRGER